MTKSIKFVILAIAVCSNLSIFAASPQNAVISAMDNPDKWQGPYPPKVIIGVDGRKSLMFDLGKGGNRKWSLKNFAKSKIKMGDYDALKFDYRVEGEILAQYRCPPMAMVWRFTLSFLPNRSNAKSSVQMDNRNCFGT